ncbi:unnamed protein product [Gongylonema pulchrum]|uniref:Uncharacterized protein n=1 Tax=Gongylonema pulchrum TaxID=637853 RepID=A0A183DPF2_9BILA|nr:unnamed protein product [Gongylonema pulchrum]
MVQNAAADEGRVVNGDFDEETSEAKDAWPQKQHDSLLGERCAEYHCDHTRRINPTSWGSVADFADKQ